MNDDVGTVCLALVFLAENIEYVCFTSDINAEVLELGSYCQSTVVETYTSTP